MNKKIKKIIAFTVAFSAISTFSVVSPNTNTNFGQAVAYASSYKASTGELSSLKIESFDGNSLDLRKESYSGKTVKLNEDKEYYTKLTDGSEGITIDATVKGSGRIVRIFTSDDSNATAYKPGDKFYISKGTQSIYVRTYESLRDFREAKDQEKDVRNCEEEYKINVKKTVASKDEDTTQDSIYLSSIKLNKGKISFLRAKTAYDVKVDADVDEIKITATPEDDDYRVRIDGDIVHESDSYRKTLHLDKGENEFKVKVTDSKDNQRTYTLNITRGKAEDKDDDVYLDNLELDEGDIEFNKKTNTYSVDVDNSIEKVIVKAEPEDDDSTVTINNEDITSDDDYKKRVTLEEGENTIHVVVKDDDDNKERTYTIKVNRAKSSKDDSDSTDNTDKTDDSNSSDKDNTSSDSGSNSNSSSDTLASTTPENAIVSENGEGWINSANGWQYKDSKGNILKNTWLHDKKQGVYCYLNGDGYRATGWLKDEKNNTWYLLSDMGVMETGWQYLDGKWYYLNDNGTMKTRWLEIKKTDDNGNKTSTWYFFNEDGSMFTGWLDCGSWYYFDGNGAMKTGWVISNGSKYYMNSDGSMQTEPKTIDGKEYKFTASGAVIL